MRRAAKSRLLSASPRCTSRKALHTDPSASRIHQHTRAPTRRLWDSIPDVAKYQIILTIGIIEVYSEHSFILEKQGQVKQAHASAHTHRSTRTRRMCGARPGSHQL